MNITELQAEDWSLFLTWAEAENWRVSSPEQTLFQDAWRQFFFVLRTAEGVQGFVSAVAYPSSGWIGNLLVNPQRRGCGYGSLLFDFALDSLRLKELQRVWLTASTSGRPLYERRGFSSVGRIDRWQGTGLGGLEAEQSAPVTELVALDSRCWRESRVPLLSVLASDGEICSSGETMSLLQPGAELWQLGPWLSPNTCPRENRLLLLQALGRTPPNRPLVADVLASANMDPLLTAAGFYRTGNNELMCLSRESKVNLQGVVALASLGSIG